jgi:Holliday junction DNA helicase RuvB
MGLDDLVGLDNLKERAAIAIKSCQQRNAVFPHTLLLGPGGLGKTEFARAIADDLNYYYEEVEAMALSKRKDIVERLQSANRSAIMNGKPLLLFVDEVHRLSPAEQEAFYYPMKEFKLTDTKGTIQIKPFSLIAATTREDLLDQASFTNRFTNIWRFTAYDNYNLCRIIRRTLATSYVAIHDPELVSAANRCLGNARLATKYASLIRDQVLAHSRRVVENNDITAVFTREQIDPIGLTKDQLTYLNALSGANGARGLSWIASVVGLHQDIVENVIEPPLIYLGFVDRTSSGRTLTDKGAKHVKL